MWSNWSERKMRNISKEYRNIIEELVKSKQYDKVEKAIEALKVELGGEYKAVCSKVLSEKYKRLVTINEFSGISVYYPNKAICSDYYKINVVKIHKELRYLAYYLNSIGIETFNTLSNTLLTKTIFDFNFIKELETHNISMVPIIDQNKDLHFRIACQTHKTNKLFIKELYKIDNIRKYILS